METKTLSTHRSFGLVIVLIAFFQFINTTSHDFAWDDKIVIQENERVQEGFSGIPDLFKKYNSDLRQDQYGYRPITLVSFAIDYEFSSANPAFFHFMNVVYFSILCLVLFLVLKRIFHRFSPLLPFLITALYTVHPIHTEVVANIKSRDEILSLLFCLISLLQLIKFIDKKHWKHLMLTVLFFVLGFLSKENAVVFLPIYLLTMCFVTDLNWKRILKMTSVILPIGIIIVFLISSYALNSQLGKSETADLGLYKENPILGNAFFYVDQFINKIANGAYLILLYLKDFIAPYNLAYYHGQGDLQPVGVSWQAILGGIVSLGAFIFAVFRFKKNPVMSFGILFFFFSISIYLHIIRTLADTRADRFMFYASIGLSILLIALVSKLLKTNFETTEKAETTPLYSTIKKLNTTQKVTYLLVLIIFSGITFSRNGVWENDFTLVENDMERLETSARPHYFYATNLLQDIQQNGWSSEKETDMIHHYRRSMELSDSIYYGRIELGGYFCDHGNLEEGIRVFEETVKLFPRTSDPRHFLGKALFNVQKYGESIEHFEKSIEYAPKSADSYYLLAIAYAKTERLNDAIKLTQKGLKEFPEAQQSMYETFGHVYFEGGDMVKSTQSTLKMIEHGGDPYKVYATIIGRYQEKGDSENAARYYQEAIQKGYMQAQR